jgi:hypothetical protein
MPRDLAGGPHPAGLAPRRAFPDSSVFSTRLVKSPGGTDVSLRIRRLRLRPRRFERRVNYTIGEAKRDVLEDGAYGEPDG